MREPTDAMQRSLHGREIQSALVTRSARRNLTALISLTGASALVLQVTWYRIIALHSGVDMAASTTVVASFLLGLGAGSLIGGRLADRLTPRSSLRVLVFTNLLIAGCAVLSTWVLYDLYGSIATALDSLGATFAFNAAVLLLPTSLLGSSLPLVARVVTTDVRDSGAMVGRLSSWNTFGAAVGAALGGWVLIGTFGVYSVTTMVAIAHLVAAVGFLGLARASVTEVGAGERPRGPHQQRLEHTAGAGNWPTHWWYLIYAGTGAIALGYEQVFFRIVDGIMRSNAYTFGHVLFLYLVLWASGAAVGARLVSKAGDLRRWFLWMLFSVGVGAMLSIVVLASVVPRSPLAGQVQRWFNSEGFAFGFNGAASGDLLLFGLVLPLFLMGLPVMFLGAAFPFAQALVAKDLPTLGRATGRLQCASLFGSVAGTLLTGFVLIERVGTSGTFLILSIPPLVAGLVAAGMRHENEVVSIRISVMALAALLMTLFPSNQAMWATLLGTPSDQVIVAEDRSCAAALKLFGDGGAGLVINGRTQNGYPFDDFHVAIGLLPALSHPDPRQALVIGFGAGSTTYGVTVSDRVRSITSVEICGGTYRLADTLALRGRTEFQAVRPSTRQRRVVGDGRRELLSSTGLYDLIVPDTLVPTSAGSNNLYSVEFFELMNSKLRDDGLLAIWSATPRVVNSATVTFPYVDRVSVGEGDSPPQIILASRSPIDLDPVRLLERFDRIDKAAFSGAQRSSLRALFADPRPECLNKGRAAPRPPGDQLNFDLRPQDEYFLNSGGLGDEAVARTCSAR